MMVDRIARLLASGSPYRPGTVGENTMQDELVKRYSKFVERYTMSRSGLRTSIQTLHFPEPTENPMSPTPWLRRATACLALPLPLAALAQQTVSTQADAQAASCLDGVALHDAGRKPGTTSSGKVGLLTRPGGVPGRQRNVMGWWARIGALMVMGSAPAVSTWRPRTTNL